jgi:hypothetical protein
VKSSTHQPENAEKARKMTNTRNARRRFKQQMCLDENIPLKNSISRETISEKNA